MSIFAYLYVELVLLVAALYFHSLLLGKCYRPCLRWPPSLVMRVINSHSARDQFLDKIMEHQKDYSDVYLGNSMRLKEYGPALGPTASS